MVTNEKKVLLFDNDKKNKNLKENKKFDQVRCFTLCKSLPISLQVITTHPELLM